MSLFLYPKGGACVLENRGSAVDRVDGPHPIQPDSKSHVHFTDGTALNYDGTPSHEGNVTPNITRKIREWLEANGWKLP